MARPLLLNELLYQRGLPRGAKTKLVRHQDSRWDLERLIALGQFDTYQEHQAKPVFECDYIVSFLGQMHSHGRLIGVFQREGREDSTAAQYPAGFPYPDMSPGKFRYKLTKLRDFDDIEQRLVIDWGASTRAWHQWLVDGAQKEVLEILPAGYVREFLGYDHFILTFDELKAIVNGEAAHREWHRSLKAVAGIYLITDSTTGQQYVGSAYGEEGVFGRWQKYSKTGHGGNVMLRALLESNEEHAKNFSFTLLRTLDKSMTRDEVFKLESLYKNKLGSRVRGLNSN